MVKIQKKIACAKKIIFEILIHEIYAICCVWNPGNGRYGGIITDD